MDLPTTNRATDLTFRGGESETTPPKREAPAESPSVEDPGHRRIDESPRLPPADEDARRGGPGGNVGGVSRPPAAPRPASLETW
jgi:hypothetical protein